MSSVNVLLLNDLGWNMEPTSNQHCEMRRGAYTLWRIHGLEVTLKRELGVTLAMFLLLPGLKGQQPSIGDGAAKAIFLPPDGNRSVEPTGYIKIKVSGADTGGAVAVLEVKTDTDFSTPIHVHHVENEWFYAIEGEYQIKVGDEIFDLKPGGSVYAPKLIPHGILDVSERGGKLMVVAQPAGHIEAFSVDLFKMIASGTHDEAAFTALFVNHNMVIVGPPMTRKQVTSR